MEGQPTLSNDFRSYTRAVEIRFAQRLKMPEADAVAELTRYACLVEAWSGSTFLTNPGRWWSRLSRPQYWRGWLKRLSPNGRATKLHRVHVATHLLGKYSVAIPRLRPTRLLIVDLDVHSATNRNSLLERLGAVEVALHHAPYVLVRSSGSGGVHVYYFFRDAHQPREIYERVAAELQRGGVKLAPGRVELLPSEAGMVRLPLGSGSCVLDERTFGPLAARLDRAGRLQRDLALGLRLFARLAEERRVDLDDLVRSRSVAVVEKSNNCDSRAPHQGSRARDGHGEGAVLHGKDYFANLDASTNGVSTPGERYNECRRRLFDLFIRQGLQRDAALNAFKRWVVTGTHNSRDLTRRPQQTIRRMLGDAPGYLDHLQRGIEDGRLVVGPKAPARSFDVALTYLLTLAQHRAAGDWRAHARAHLTAADHRLLAGVAEEWVRRRLAVLIGLLRFGETEHGPLSRVTLSREALQKIAGGRPPPTSATAAAGSEKSPRAAYRVVVDAARRLGLLAPEMKAIPGVRSQVFAVALPVRTVEADVVLLTGRRSA